MPGSQVVRMSAFGAEACTLPDELFQWQLEARRTMMEAIQAGHHPRSFAAHLPVMITFDPDSPFLARAATKGAGLTPRDERLDGYIGLLEDTLTRCQGRPWRQTLPERVAAVRALLDHPEDIDRRRLGFLEIFQHRTYANLQRDPRVVLHFTGEGPNYLSFQLNGYAEILGPDHRLYRYISLARRIFEEAPFHLQQPGYAAAYLVWVHEVVNKTPYVVPATPGGPFSHHPQAEAAPAPHSEVAFRQLLVPIDNSKYSSWAIDITLQVAGAYRATVVGSHVYAARLHDQRFRDMESGLPEKYQEPGVLAHQRTVHNSLIDKGLRLVSESYLQGLNQRCQQGGLEFVGKALEGKNYAELARDIEASNYDLVVMGVRGIGESWRHGLRQDQVLGSVCQRVVRRVRQDVLVVKNDRPLEDSFVVGVDGSDRSFAALRMALGLAKTMGVRVQAVAVYDPFLHRALFYDLEGVLTEEARQVFNTEQQKKLHEQLIDSGIAKIYGNHLARAQQVAAEMGMEIETHLLQGKPYVAILRHVVKTRPSLLALGRTGVHADEGLDIGSNTENLLRLAPCHVLLVGRPFTPGWAETGETVEEGPTWTAAALARLERVPPFVRGVARKAIEDYARERQLAVVDEQVMQEARQRFGI